MAKSIPNAPATGSKRPSGIFAADIDGFVDAFAGDGVLSGLGVSPQGTPDMTVAVAAGLVRVGGYFAYVSAQNVTIAAADGTNPRFDLIACDYNGTVSRVAGTAAALPVVPDIPANSISLAKIFVPAGATEVSNAGAQQMVYDDRCVLPDSYDIFADFMGSSLSATVATSAGSIGECGWTMSASGTAGAPAFQTSGAAHRGILRSVTGTTSGNNVRWHFGNAANTAIMVPAEISRMTFVVRIPTITTGAWKLGFGVDLSDAASSSLGTAGAFIEFVPATSAKWAYVTRQASTSTRNVDTGADVVANNWYQFDIIRKQNGNVQFLKNGALMFEHTTNLPSTAGNIGTLTHTLTAAARNLDHDLFGLNFAPTGTRWT